MGSDAPEACALERGGFFARIGRHIPGCELVAGDDRRAVDFNALGITGLKCGRCLDYPGRARSVSNDGRYDVLGFNLVHCAHLPFAVHVPNPASQTKQQFSLMNRLSNQGSTVFDRPGSSNWAP